METNEIVALTTVIASLVNVGILAFQAWKKLKPEVKKMEAEGDSEVVESSYKSLEGAVLSQNMLKERVDELQRDLIAEKKSRRDDADYFRRRIKDIEKEARDYRLWAARLAKQVIEAGKVPVPFITSLNDTDPLMTAITKEQEELDKAKGVREAELKEAAQIKQDDKNKEKK